jgi:serine protease
MSSGNLVIKYRDDIDLRDAKPDLPLPENALRLWAALMQDVGSATLSIRRLFAAVDPQALAALIALAQTGGGDESHAEGSTYRPPTFENFLWVSYSDPSQSSEDVIGIAAKIADEISRWSGVESAYVRLPDKPASEAPQRPITRPRPRPPAPPTVAQSAAPALHLQAAPNGIGALAAWLVPGGNGAGQTLVDIERGWFLRHKALLNAQGRPRAVPSRRNSSGMAPEEEWPHGTSVLGLICAADTGVAPGIAEMEASSVWGGSPTAEAILLPTAVRLKTALRLENDFARSQAVSDCLNTVVLIEMHSELIGQSHFFPVEIYPETFAVIELLTNAHVTVVEPAGNGLANLESVAIGRSPPPASVDLDSLEKFIQSPYGLPQKLRSLNTKQSSALPATATSIALAAFADSGAIMVSGAVVVASSRARPKCSRQFNANFGSRVNCFAQGADVSTLDYDPRDAGARSARFGGTSAASAIIAGAALCVQGMAQTSGQGSLRAREMRALLANAETGTKADDPNTINIGVMPNLAHALGQIKNLANSGKLVRTRRVP